MPSRGSRAVRRACSRHGGARRPRQTEVEIGRRLHRRLALFAPRARYGGALMATRQSKLLRLQEGMGALATLSDQQATAFVAHEVADEAFVRAFEAHFEGMDVLNDENKVQAAVRLRNSIKRGIERQLDAVIEMGRALLDAERAFTRQEWDHLLDGGQQ